MTPKELKKLTRKDLLQLLIQQSKQVKELEEKLKIAEAALQDRSIHIQEAGSIAEASLRVYGVFETAQIAADAYLENVRALTREHECAKQKAAEELETWRSQMRLQTERQCAEDEEETQRKCDAMRAKAEADTRKYWDEVVRRVEPLYEEFPGLKDRVNGFLF